jgi:hypothetical protein
VKKYFYKEYLMNGRRKFLIGMCIGLFVTGIQLGAQPATVNYNKTTEDYLVAQFQSDRSEVIGQWAAKNPSLLNGRGPSGFSPLEMAVKRSAISSFTALLDGGADQNALWIVKDGVIDLLLLVHLAHADDLSLMKQFSQSYWRMAIGGITRIPLMAINSVSREVLLE